MNTIEAMMRVIQATRLREPMTRVPVFKEAHPQKFESLGSFGMVKQNLKLKSVKINLVVGFCHNQMK